MGVSTVHLHTLISKKAQGIWEIENSNINFDCPFKRYKPKKIRFFILKEMNGPNSKKLLTLTSKINSVYFLVGIARIKF